MDGENGVLHAAQRNATREIRKQEGAVRPDDALFDLARREGARLTDVCRRARVSGHPVADAWFAALAIESGCEWITTNRDYARFDGLRWRSPLPPR